MRWDAPAPTLTTRCNSLSNGRYGHPEQRRAISLREAARLQSFPDSFVFHVRSVAEGARLVGNAVPVSLARSLALSLLREHRQSPQSDSAEKKSKPSARARSTTTGRSRVSVR
jgi:DNA (cytosine-5)-methyltransferase 1